MARGGHRFAESTKRLDLGLIDPSASFFADADRQIT
jgi:hypothetical protein